jgi:hypothetical protein
MYKISDEQITFILNDIRRNGVEMKDLQLNLLDHICCIIENELEENGDFGQFYFATVKTFYKSQLSEIEQETKALLNNKYYYQMKKSMFISGAISASLITLGILFKFMHWPGAGVILVFGISLFSLIFLPLLFTTKLKEKKSLQDKSILGAGSIIAILISMAILFKIMHWPGANMMGVVSLLIMLIIYIPLYFFSGIKNQEAKANTIITSILLVAGCGLFMALARAPHSSRALSVKETSSYLRNELIYRTERSQTGEFVSNEAFIKTSKELLTVSDELKSDILEWETGLRVMDTDFESKNALISDSWVKIYFEQNEKAKKKLLELNTVLKNYNAEQKLLENEKLNLIPEDITEFDRSEEKIVGALGNIIQLQMLVLQNLRELKVSKVAI